MARKNKKSNIYKLSRNTEDANDALSRRCVKLKELIEFTGTVKQFIDRITIKNSGYIHLQGQGLTHLWWEDKEEWFMNTAHQNNKKISRGGWFIAKDLPDILKGHIRRGGKLYFTTK